MSENRFCSKCLCQIDNCDCPKWYDVALSQANARISELEARLAVAEEFVNYCKNEMCEMFGEDEYQDVVCKCISCRARDYLDRKGK